MLIISIEELCEAQHVTQDFIIEIVDYGIAEPISGERTEEWLFDTASARWLDKAIQLHQDLEIDWFAVAIIVELLKQKEALLSDNDLLQSRLQRME